MKNQTKLGIGIGIGAAAMASIGATQEFRIDAVFAWCALGLVAAIIAAVSVPRLRKLLVALLMFITASAKAFILLGILIGAAIGLIGWGAIGLAYEVRSALPPRLAGGAVQSVSDVPRAEPIHPAELRECDEGPWPCDADDGGEPEPKMLRRIGS